MDLLNRLPATGAGFVWETERIPVLRPTTDGAVAAFTTRLGGVSNGPVGKLNMSMTAEQEHGDTVGFLRVFANRDLASRAIGGAPKWSSVQQVHGSDVVYASGRRPPADAQWTDEPDRTLAVVSADCVLVLAVGPMRIGVAHAGWRGMVAGVVERLVDAVEAEEVFAGPAIGPCCFEVGAEVTDEFRARYSDS
ncbi:MAG: laccase domain-containing protein, partial [Actinomycetota bacterium]